MGWFKASSMVGGLLIFYYHHSCPICHAPNVPVLSKLFNMFKSKFQQMNKLVLVFIPLVLQKVCYLCPTESTSTPRIYQLFLDEIINTPNKQIFTFKISSSFIHDLYLQFTVLIIKFPILLLHSMVASK